MKIQCNVNLRTIEWRKDKRLIHDICYNCGSTITKQSFAYFNLMFNCGSNGYGEICEQGFYIVNKGKKHWRLIEIAVANHYQKKGFGKLLLFRLLSQMKDCGVELLTFRTPIDEEAQNFWIKMGAKITGLKDNDYEMQIKIKK